jgi:hypothetical protein
MALVEAPSVEFDDYFVGKSKRITCACSTAHMSLIYLNLLTWQSGPPESGKPQQQKQYPSTAVSLPSVQNFPRV